MIKILHVILRYFSVEFYLIIEIAIFLRKA